MERSRNDLREGARSALTISPSSGIDVLAVMRGTQHAAKHISNDGLMFNLVCDGLQEQGLIVYQIAESDLAEFLELTESRGEPPASIISMAQRPENVALLAKLGERGVPIVNTPDSVANCYRTELVEVLGESEIPFAKSLTAEVDEDNFDGIADSISLPFWLKRGDIHAAHANDVCKIENREEYWKSVADFQSRGIQTVLAQEHLVGDVVKFYAVRGGDFFHAQYFESGVNVSFDTTSLEEVADAAAARLGLSIYGGDVVMTSDRGPVLIDLNAWPSFGTVRDAAAPQIVKVICSVVDRR